MEQNWNAFDLHISDGRNPNERKLANNTYAVRRGDAIAIRLHKTDVLLWHEDRVTVSFFTGGWFTVTTKDRLNAFGPDGWNVWADRSIWSLHGPDGFKTRFWDGMRLDPICQTVENESDGPNFAAMDRSNGQIRKLIAGYLRGLTDETIADVLTQDGRGDCLYCQIGSPFGPDHLESHLRENYYMPNLIRNAYRTRGYPNADLVLSIDGRYGPNRIRSVVGKYLRSELLENTATN